MSNQITAAVPVGYTLTLTANAVSAGTYTRLGEPGSDTIYDDVSLAAGAVVRLGPFNEYREYKLLSYNGVMTYTLAYKAVLFDDVALVSQVGNGTAGTGVTAVEYGDGKQHTTILTIASTLPSIAGGANLSVGKLIYTLPAGAIIIDKATMSVGLTQSQGHVNADTPDMGIGTVIAAGANALCSDTSGAENILTGQTVNNCTGTAEIKTVADQILVIESSGAHTVYLNVCDGWAASGDTALGVAGTVVLHWQLLA